MKDSSEDNEHITFSELCLLESTDVVPCVPVEIAIKICNHHLAQDDTAGAQIFHLWVDKLLTAYKLSIENLVSIKQCFSNCFCTTLKNIPDSKDSGLLITWVNDFKGLLSWMQTAAIDTLPLIDLVLEVICSLFDRNRQSGNNNASECFAQHAISITSELLKFLDAKNTIIYKDFVSTFSAYTEVISKLCNLTEFDALNFKMACEVHKFIGKFTISLANCRTFHTESTNGWAKQPFKLVLQKVNDNMQSLNKKAQEEVNENYLEKCVRVINFYIKLLLKMSSSYRHESFPVAPEFFKSFVFFKSIPVQVPGTKVADYVSKYLNKDMEEIFCMICKNTTFTELLIDDSVGLLMIMEYLKAIVKNHDEYYMNDNSGFLLNLLLSISKDVSIIYHPEYSSVVAMYATLVVLNTNGELKKGIVLQVIKGDFHVALISVDILLVVGKFCYKRGMITVIDEDFEFWRKCNNRFSRFSDNRRQIFAKRLIRQFCLLRSRSNLERELDLKENFRSSLEIAPVIYNGTNKNFQFLNDLMGKLHVQLEKINGNWVVADYYQLISTMKMLARLKVKISIETQKKIIELLQKVFGRSDNFQTLFRFTNACLELSLNFHPHTIEIMMSFLNEWFSHDSHSRTSPMEVLCLSAYASHFDPNVRKLAVDMLQSLDRNSNDKVLRLILNREPRNVDQSKHYKLHRPNLSHVDLSLDVAHSCLPSRFNGDCLSSIAKRSCLEGDPNGYLSVIFENMKRIEILAEQKILNLNDSIHLKAILDSLNKILSKHDN